MAYDGYFVFGGNEIVNSERVRGYARTAACPMHWLKDQPCTTLPGVLGDGEYLHSEIDQAPWYDPNMADVSERFYGVYGLDASLLDNSTRSVSIRQGVGPGASFGLERKGPRSVRIRAMLMARGQDALSYGRSWLEAALDANACGQHGDRCGTTDLQYFDSCPPERATIHGFTDWVEHAKNYLTTPSFEGMENAGGVVPVYENLALDPSFETITTPNVNVRLNYHRNPVNANSTGGLAWGNSAYSSGGAVGTYTVNSGWQVINATSIPAGGRVGYFATVPLGTSAPSGTLISMRLNTDLSTLPAPLKARVYVDAVAADGVTLVGHWDGFFTGQVVMGSLTTTADAATLRWYVWLESATAWTGAQSFYTAWATIEVGVPVGWPFYGGGQMAGSGEDVDLTAAWMGTPSESSSVLRGRRPVGISSSVNFASLYQSEKWASTGVRSLVVMPSGAHNASYGSAAISGLTAGATYTAVAKVRLDAAQTGTLHPTWQRQIMAQSVGMPVNNVLSNRPANQAGVSEVRVTFTLGTSTTATIFFMNGSSGTPVWFDDFMLVPGVYTGPYFDGGYRPRVRENRAIRPIASDGWTMTIDGGGTQLLSVVDDVRFGGEKARKSEMLTAGSGGYIFPGSTVNGMQVGDVWTISMKYAAQGYSGAEPYMAFGGGLPPLATTLGSGTIDNGDGTKTAWRTVQVTESRSGSTNPILSGFGSRPAGMVLLAGEALWEKSATLGKWFSGDTAQDPGFSATWTGTANLSRSYVFDVDFGPEWTGTPNASPSVLMGQEAFPVTGVRASVILSSHWSKSGRKSLRVISKGGPAGPNSNDTFAQIVIPTALRGGGTFLATSYLKTPIVGASSLVGEIMVAAPIVEKKRANVAGAVDLRLTYGALSGTYSARLYHGGPEGSADVWFDCAGLFAGNYEGPWFDGNLTAPGDPELARYRWLGEVGFSESVYEVRERTSRPQTDEEWSATVDDNRFFLHDTATISGPYERELMNSGDFWAQIVEWTWTSERPWTYGVTRPVNLPVTPSTVIEDVQYNLIPYPSMELPGGNVILAENLTTNPSLETNATGWIHSTTSVSGSDPVPFSTSGRSTDIAAVGAASFRSRLLGNGSTAASGRARQNVLFDTVIPSTPARARVSVTVWAAVIKSGGSAATVVHSLAARLDWQNSGGSVIGTVSLGTASAAELNGRVFSAKSLLPPVGTATARVVVFAESNWESSATPANNSDVRLYADALAVTIP